jgi:hypothetical protein
MSGEKLIPAASVLRYGGEPTLAEADVVGEDCGGLVVVLGTRVPQPVIDYLAAAAERMAELLPEPIAEAMREAIAERLDPESVRAALSPPFYLGQS